ncbi:AmmeMemoRadiSam system protein B [Natronoflexus pectinivorans]|uniref:AMMECR1 domain-containing protein n=1 Tax=Natronoflexus pectinivorans TaxID=682526 RepID=A0A4R2GB93_9BACT|nr:AmmeMemoRadiSam system protein B [Natronoflexus pectinivorans]TCO04982.1 hypothetical protein EV194_11748 [Natronoflexus pectinivorans]
MEVKRVPAVAGLFYEDNPALLLEQIKSLFAGTEVPVGKDHVKALILPHAGYIFSGEVAATGINRINPDSRYDNIFLIGTSHRMSFNGASLYQGDYFITPLGAIPVNHELVQTISSESPCFNFNSDAHIKEHSLEVQLPLLQYHLQYNFNIVPILIGTRSLEICGEIAAVLEPYFNQNNLFIISTDFSHYPNYNDAVELDTETANAIIKNNPELLLKTLEKHDKENTPGLSTSLCGWSSVLTLMNMTEHNTNLKYAHVQYKNSGDSPIGDKAGVVGYHSIVITESQNEFALLKSEQEWLIRCALNGIEDAINSRSTNLPENEIPDGVKIYAGAFVSVYLNNELNGCIGHIGSDELLWKNVLRCARAAATEDNRFSAIVPEDFNKISVEISVLTPPKMIDNIDLIIPGKHGILIKKGSQQGTFLPHVAKKMNWNTLEMLEHCSRDKAKIGKDGWKKSEIYIYEAIVFKSNQA